MARVVVAMSGGVDSSVAAYLIQQQGHEVIGLFMKNWHDVEVTREESCPWQRDSQDALLVAQHLNIPFQVVDLSEEYYHRVVCYMFDEYQKGRTPNPDVLCNREIKFDAFWEVCQSLSADYVATGHYCQKRESAEGGYQLLRGKDEHKDQSYFLCQLSQEQLAHSLFPIGELRKSEVRQMALDVGIPVAQKKDSQGLCFVGKIKLPTFLGQRLKPKEGAILKVDDNAELFQTTLDVRSLVDVFDREYLRLGSEIGKHPGSQFFTIGQRKGLHLGGYKNPLFVIHIDSQKNIVYVGEGNLHRGLYKTRIRTKMEDVNWLVTPSFFENEQNLKKLTVQVRYRQEALPACLQIEENYIYTQLGSPCFAVAKGQFLVWYFEDTLVGSGVIDYAV